ncbi:hypothetical protein [Pedobacter sp. N23S346]|uniref:hypothetical protein n=1 Tax=Pedobacter sp. N23S346 TaxID=3402750 RepID=UPI003AC2F0F5
MTEYLFQIEELEGIEADLDTISKYHDGTKRMLHVDKSNIVKTRVNIRMLYQLEKERVSLFNDFNIAKVIEQVQIDPKHVQNLFVLLRNMNDIEWGYYQSYFSSDDAVTGVNLHSELRRLLTDVKILKEQYEGRGILETKIKLRKLMKAGKTMVPYDVPNMGVTIDNLEDNKDIIELIIGKRHKQIKELKYLYFHITDDEPRIWSTELIDEILQYLYQPFPDFRAKWLFGRFATQNILAYLNGETDLHTKDVEINKQEGVLIYTLFLMFGVLDIAIEDNTPVLKSEQDKAKLIRSFLRQDLKSKEVEFYNILFSPY